MARKLVCGVGVNDADYVVQQTVNGKRVWCPFYRVWAHMLERCYNKKFHARRLTYIGCSVCDEWLLFSNFKAWMQKQDWVGKQLDKDLLLKGNKVYSPENCVFVDLMTNSFTTDSSASRGEWPIGVCFNKPVGKFQSNIHNPFTKKQEHIGYFNCSDEAHLAWKKRKHELSCQIADLQTDRRVADALRARYV